MLKQFPLKKLNILKAENKAKVSLNLNNYCFLSFSIKRSTKVFLRFSIKPVKSKETKLNSSNSFYFQPAIHISNNNTNVFEKGQRKQCESFCDSNPRRHILSMNSKFRNEFAHIIERVFKRSNEEMASNRGVLLMPYLIDSRVSFDTTYLPLLADLSLNTEYIFKVQWLNLSEI